MLRTVGEQLHVVQYWARWRWVGNPWWVSSQSSRRHRRVRCPPTLFWQIQFDISTNTLRMSLGSQSIWRHGRVKCCWFLFWLDSWRMSLVWRNTLCNSQKYKLCSVRELGGMVESDDVRLSSTPTLLFSLGRVSAYSSISLLKCYVFLFQIQRDIRRPRIFKCFSVKKGEQSQKAN